MDINLVEICQNQNIDSLSKLSFKKPIKNYRCTNILCLFISFIFLGFFIIMGIYAFQNFSPKDLALPHDLRGLLLSMIIIKYSNK